MIVIVPTRGRPEAVTRLIEAWYATRATAHLRFIVNETDERLVDYLEILSDPKLPRAFFSWLRAPSDTMVSALNWGAVRATTRCNWDGIVGFMGDDHLPRTPNWDLLIEEAFRTTGPAVVYANDLLQGENLPTQVFLPTEFVRRLGRIAPPTLKHLYVDNYWREVGVQSGCLRYMSHIVIEHMHPVAGKAEWDDNYRRVNAGELYGSDHEAFNAFVASGMLEADAQLMKDLYVRWTRDGV